MTFQDCAQNHFSASSRHDANLNRARIAGYVLLTGLFLEVVASMVWFKGTESLASLVAIALVAAGVAGEIFFEGRAQRADKASAIAPSAAYEVSETMLKVEALPSISAARPNTSKHVSQMLNRDRRRLVGARRRGRAA